ncbi:hypothetical protein [Janthinobacterium sp. PAMC25594]|uniref:hypothetical protein n=1 Tax=Janthinobacterium sp. PAMC25594 TaxID=2861284 RepID=UPI001C6279DC|nr:hypothetical protein [Janthinobacterium sp. PAMC25594]QYG06065.1 hypothetical protein KY494_22695 [Janthinobacterium sp. PAMC25594]
MSKRFASISEGDAAQFLATLNVLPCQSFSPDFQTEFTDKRGFTGTYLPDFKHTCHVTGKVTFFETKFAALNSKQSHETSENKLRAQYRYRFGDDTGLKYHEISKTLWNSHWRSDCLLHAFNHSLTKHLLIQKALSRENYIVIFGNDLPLNITEKYTKKGLFYLHISELADYLTPAK